MSFKRIIALLLSVVLILSSLTSCSKTAEEIIDGAETALGKKPYTVEVEVDYRCNDLDASGIFEQIERTDTVIYVDGSYVKAAKDMSISYDDGDYRFVDIYTVIDGVAYYEMDYDVAGIPHRSKSKAVITDEQTYALFSGIAMIGDVSVSDFDDVTAVSHGRDSVITCQVASESAIIAMERIMASQLELDSESKNSVKATKIEMTVETDGGRYDSITVKCDYRVTLDGKAYDVSMSVELEFNYDDYFEINRPSDLGEYNDVGIENIL